MKKSRCVWGGGAGILMNYLIFGNTWFYKFQLGKCAFYEFFSTFYSIYWRCLWKDKQTSMHNNVYYPPWISIHHRKNTLSEPCTNLSNLIITLISYTIRVNIPWFSCWRLLTGMRLHSSTIACPRALRYYGILHFYCNFKIHPQILYWIEI